MVAHAVSGGVEISEAVLPPLSLSLRRGLFGMFGEMVVPSSLFGLAFSILSHFSPPKNSKKNEKMRKKKGLFAESVFCI